MQPANTPRATITRTPHLHHPVVVEHAARRAANVQLRIADAITTFAGSMPFVYIHIVAFACWMLFLESDPWPRLTLIVSLEAIFLSTFVMIGQNRQAEFQHAKADHDFSTEAQELRANTELTACGLHADDGAPPACPRRRYRGRTCSLRESDRRLEPATRQLVLLVVKIPALAARRQNPSR